MIRLFFAFTYLVLTVVAQAGAAEADSQQPLSTADVRKQVDALKKEDVSWRHIEWKTCLIDGLKASREQHKPIVLWIFIDRPIDDERC